MRAVIFYMAALAVLPLAGCTSKSVETVKTMQSQNKNFTIGQILGNRDFCDEKWSDSKNPAGDTIVEYSCSSVLEKAVIEGERNRLREQVKNSVDSFAQSWARKEQSATKDQEFSAAALAEYEKAESELREAEANPVLGERDGFNLDGLRRSVAENQQRKGFAQQRAEADLERKNALGARRVKYLAGLQEAADKDLAAIGELYPKPIKVEQHVFFQVDGSRARPFHFKYLVDGKEVSFDLFNAFFISSSELTNPKSAENAAQWEGWWAAKLPPFRSQAQRYLEWVQEQPSL